MADPRYIDSVLKSAQRLTRRATRHLYFETYAPVFAKAMLVIGIFLIASFSGIWERIGDPFRLIILILALFVLVQAFWFARQKTRPNLSAARRRVEGDSNIKHRPLDTLYDHAALSSEAWPLHYENAVQSVHRLVPSKRRAVLSPLDPYFLRFAVPFLLMLAMMVGYGDNLERLRRSVMPTWQAGVNPSKISFEAWIDPPDYTGRPPIYFKGKQAVEIPTGSELVARIAGAKSAPRLKLTTENRSRYISLKRIDPKTLEARTVLKSKAKARWRVGSTLQSWDLNVIADTAPTLKFEDTPKADKRDRLVLNYSFEDDYGVEALELHMQQLSNDSLDSPVEIVSIPLQSRSVKRVEKRVTELDLTKHVWAGKKVSAVLVARDGLGQETRSDPEYYTIPDKIFIEPLAKAIVEQRILVLAGNEPYAPLPEVEKIFGDTNWKNGFDTYEPKLRLERAPQSVQNAVALIDAVTDMPAGLFEDPAVYMGLRNTASQLRYARSQDAIAGVPDNLWSIAIRAEFGLLGTALEEMREAEKNLRDGIARRAPQREVDTLFDRYNAAVDRYMEELRKNAEISQSKSSGGGGSPRDADEIQELLKAIEEANRIGDTEGARKALARLADLLEKLKIELTMGQGQGDGESMPGEMTEEMMKALEEMADLLGEQRELKDQTDQAENENGQNAQNGSRSDGSEAGQNPQDGPQGQGSTGLSPQELAAQQKALQDALDKLAEAIGEETLGKSGATPGEDGSGSGGEEDSEQDGDSGGGKLAEDNDADANTGSGKTIGELLKEAERAMAESEGALEGENFNEASEAQSEAIQALRNAGQALAQASRGNKGGGSDGEGETNPLGENNNGVNDDNLEADIDTRDKATRSRELLEELRKRAAEQEREQLERDYLERLLKRF